MKAENDKKKGEEEREKRDKLRQDKNSKNLQFNDVIHGKALL